jgi:hypothetical protein
LSKLHGLVIAQGTGNREQGTGHQFRRGGFSDILAAKNDNGETHPYNRKDSKLVIYDFLQLLLPNSPFMELGNLSIFKQ